MNVIKILNEIVSAIRSGQSTDRYRVRYIDYRVRDTFNNYRFSRGSLFQSLNELREEFVRQGVPEVNTDIGSTADRVKYLRILFPHYSFTIYLRYQTFCLQVLLTDHIEYLQIGREVNVRDLLKFMLLVNERMSQWEIDWKEVVVKGQKKAKKKMMAENVIRGLMVQKMQGKPFPYYLQCQKERVKVSFCVGKKQVSMVLYHNKFLEQIDKVISTAEAMDNLIRELGQTMMISAYNANHPWITPDSQKENEE